MGGDRRTAVVAAGSVTAMETGGGWTASILGCGGGGEELEPEVEPDEEPELLPDRDPVPEPMRTSVWWARIRNACRLHVLRVIPVDGGKKNKLALVKV